MYLSNFPKIDLSPASFYMVSPPEKNMNKTQYKSITAFLANNHVFRRLIDWNRIITHNETLFLRIFQNFHQVCAKITRRFGNPLYPIFRGDLSSFKIIFPKVTLSPLLNDPPFLSYHRAQSQISINNVDKLVESLFPATKNPLPDHNSWPPAKKALRAVTLAHPRSQTSFDDIKPFFSSTLPPPQQSPPDSWWPSSSSTGGTTTPSVHLPSNYRLLSTTSQLHILNPYLICLQFPLILWMEPSSSPSSFLPPHYVLAFTTTWNVTVID